MTREHRVELLEFACTRQDMLLLDDASRDGYRCRYPCVGNIFILTQRLASSHHVSCFGIFSAIDGSWKLARCCHVLLVVKDIERAHGKLG